MEQLVIWAVELLGVPWSALEGELAWLLLSTLGAGALAYVAYVAFRPDNDAGPARSRGKEIR